MFKKIQNYLLLHHPLLWNLKVLPALSAIAIFHLLFFIIGYCDGEIIFDDPSTEYIYDIIPSIVVFFSVLIAILLFVLWAVFYFRNNAYKSFYPKKDNALYTEWVLIAIICLFNCTYSASYLFAKDFRARNYYNEQEAERRLDIIAMSSIFVTGPYELGEFINDTSVIRIKRDSFDYNNRKYSIKSLLNKSIDGFAVRRIKDSVSGARVKNWLANDKKDSVQWLMDSFCKIVAEHHLKSNINRQQWFNMVYNAPDFTAFKEIGRTERYINYAQQPAPAMGIENNALVIDTISNTLKTINGQRYIYPKYYLPFSQLQYSYEKIARAWHEPVMNTGLLLVYLYFGIAASMLFFSFRVTSGRSWLIAVLCIGIFTILTGIFSIIASSSILYLMIWLLLIIGLLSYFGYKAAQKSAKGVSAIVLNNLLWLLPALIPVIYGLTYTYVELSTVYDAKMNALPKSASEQWILIHGTTILYINILFIALYMYFLTIRIKRWKGIAEA